MVSETVAGRRFQRLNVANRDIQKRFREMLIEIIPELRSRAWRLRSLHLTEVLERPPTRILFLVMCYDDSDNRPRIVELIAKVYGNDSGAQAIAALRQLRQSGFRAPARYQVPKPYGYSSERTVLLQTRAPGLMWADILRKHEPWLTRACAEAASWLIHLQRAPLSVETGAQHDDLGLIQRCASELTEAFPLHASRLRQLAERLVLGLRSEQTMRVPSHGDYHPENVFLAPGTTTVVDFDTVGLREPAFDVGYAVGQLLTMSYISLGRFAPGARAALTFWSSYESASNVPWPRIALHTARSLLHSLYYELCALRNDRADLLGVWPELMEEWLRSGGPATLERLVHYR